MPRPRDILASASLVATVVLASTGRASASAPDASGQVAAWGRAGLGIELVPQPPTLLGAQSAACATLLDRTAMVMSDGSLRVFPDADAPAELQAPGSCRAVFGGFQGYFAVLQSDGAFRVFWSRSYADSTTSRMFEGRECVMATLTARGITVLRSDGALEQSCSLSGAEDCGVEKIPEDLGPCRWIAGGHRHLLAVQVDGSVRAWGDNDLGQVDGPAPSADCVARPANLGPCTRVAGGYAFSLALRQDGVVRAWGDNAARNEPAGVGQCDVPADLGVVTAIAAGWTHAVALRSDGSVRAWGSNNYAQCEGAPDIPAASRRKPADLGTARHVTAGAFTTVAVLADGSIEPWGDNQVGQCDAPRSTGRFTRISAGASFFLGLRADGSIAGWGVNDRGQVGGPDGPDIRGRPEPMPPCTQVSAGLEHSLAIREDGVVLAWGDNRRGQCDVPVNLGPCMQVSASQTMSYAIRTDGQLRRWGTRVDVADEVFMPEDLGPCVRVAANSDHTLVVEADGAVTGWGTNRDFQVEGQPPPDWGSLGKPADLGPCREVSVGGAHSLALRLDGTVRAWGSNNNNQCEVPASLTEATAIAAGSISSVALRPDGSVCMWGYDDPFAVRPPSAGSFTAVSSRWQAHYAIASASSSDCEGSGATATAMPRINGSPWSEMGAWTWSDGGLRVPGSDSVVDLGAYGSIGSDCAAEARLFQSRSGSTLYAPVVMGLDRPTESNPVVVHDEAALAGTLSLQVRGMSGSLPPQMEPIPVLRARRVEGGFDLLLTNLPPPAGKFLTLAPRAVGDATLMELRLLDLPGGLEVSEGAATAFTGSAVAASTLDLDRDGFDDLALAISFGPDNAGLVQVLLNDGLGGLGASSVLKTVPPEPTCLDTGDLDGDGFDDLVVGLRSDSTLRLFRSQGPSELQLFRVITVQNGPATCVTVIPGGAAALRPAGGSVAAGTQSKTVNVYSGATGEQTAQITVAGTPTTVRGGDTGGRSGTDLVTGGRKSASLGVVSSPDGFVDVLRAAGESYEVAQSLSLNGVPERLDVADIDGDGLDEIVTANAEPSAGGSGGAVPVLALFRNRAGTLGGAVALAPEGASAGLDVALVDADGDGDRDIVSVQRTLGTASEAVLLRVDTNGPDAPIALGQSIRLPVEQPSLVARGNLDGVGGEDVFLVGAGGGAAATAGGRASPILGTIAPAKFGDIDGSGTVDFGDVTVLMLDFGPCAGCPGDLDGSGTVDFGDVVLVLLSFG